MKMFNIQCAMCHVQRTDPRPGSASFTSHIAHRTSHIAFTLVELMVSVAITALLILAINQVFSSVSKAVRIGIGASEVLQNSRILGDQLERDFDSSKILGPGSGGVLVIVNQQVTGTSDKGVHVLRSDDLNEDGIVDTTTPSPDGEPRRASVRDDQIMFIRRKDDTEEPLAPANTNSYSNSSDATYIKVWYGHCLRTLASGYVPTSGNGGALGTDLTGSSDKQAANHFASEWVLGRQAIFLDPTPSGANVDGAFYNATATSGNTLSSPFPNPPLYMALTDIAQYGLDTEPAGGHGCMVGGTEDTLASQATYRLWESLGANEYASRAYSYLYGVSGVSPSGTPHRLMVNSLPGNTDYASWQIAQMTPYLAGHVADFVVEFAGDYATGTFASGVTATTGVPDGQIDRYNTSDGGGIIWYGLTVVPPSSAAPAAGTSAVPSAFINKSATTVQENPIYDAQSATDHRYVFRHNPGAINTYETNWPSLIRIRYRLVDSKGQIAGADGEPGRWFEQIMKVKQ